MHIIQCNKWFIYDMAKKKLLHLIVHGIYLNE